MIRFRHNNRGCCGAKPGNPIQEGHFFEKVRSRPKHQNGRSGIPKETKARFNPSWLAKAPAPLGSQTAQELSKPSVVLINHNLRVAHWGQLETIKWLEKACACWPQLLD
jgi:hypothetical protein